LGKASDDADDFNRLGHEALLAGDAALAVRLFGQAILIAPSAAHLHANIAAAHLALQHTKDAEAHARRAIRLDPALAEGHHNLGNALFAIGDAEAALVCFRVARDLDPASEAHWTNFLFTQIFCAGETAQAVFAENRAWGLRIEAAVGPVDRPVPMDRDPERPLHLAYFLPELDTHVTPRFLAPVLAAHDRDCFRLSVYGHRTDGRPPLALLSPPGVRWIDTRGLAPSEIATVMRRDGVDVLIHPCTFKARYRVVLAHRAAPVQMAGINFVSSSGLGAADYILGDAVLTPPGKDEDLFTEKVVRLPLFNCYGIPDDAPPVADLPALRNGFVRFGSLNNPTKIGDAALGAWAEVLRCVPASRILLKHRAFDDADIREHFTSRFAAAGVDAGRLDFAGFTADVRGYLASYDEIDIALDPFPFNGGTTSYEAIWMGVPVLTRTGAGLMGSQTTSLMAGVGHPEFVSDSKSTFVDKAVALCSDLGCLAEVRAGLRAAARASIFNGVRYTRSLEDAVRDAWRNYCIERRT
jgi:protein O-GlcNAc transferase